MTPGSPESSIQLLSNHCCEQGTQLWPVCSPKIPPGTQIVPGTLISVPALQQHWSLFSQYRSIKQFKVDFLLGMS